MIGSVVSVLEQAVAAGSSFGGEVWWRGHADASWRLKPSVQRGERNERYEQNVTVRFLRAAPTRHAKCPSRDDLSGWLQFMQHYRLPTRLLDWSQSPLVALFFAVTELPDKDGALWVLSPFALNEIVAGERIVLNSTDQRVQELIAPAFNMKRRGASNSLAVFGDELDLRMALQLAAFTIHGSTEPLEEQPRHSEFLRKLIVPAAIKEDLAGALWILGVRRSNLFPDLDNLSRELADLEFQA